jgi:uncharacterized protein
MENTDVAPAISSTPALIAPLWHTAVVVIILLGLSAMGAVTAHFQSGLNPAAAKTRIPSYVLTIVMEWLVLGIIGFGIRRRGVRIRDLIGGTWSPSVQALCDFGIAVAFLFAALVILGVLGRLLHATPNQAVRGLIPQTLPETVLYLLLALTAGFCEEIVFRGYLQRQFSALTNSSHTGLVLQGLIFGAAHGYQGLRYMLMIAVYGCMFQLLAQWRRSLRPGIIAHFLQDGGVGLVARHSTKLLCW